MSKLITVHGSGGHGRVVTNTALLLGYQVIATDDKWHKRPGTNQPCHMAVGDNAVRKQFLNHSMVTLIHPAACVDASVRIGDGCFVGPLAVVNVAAKVGQGCILNTGCIIEHDCEIGDWCHVSPGAVLCGTVRLGEGCWVGANAVIRQGITIAPWVTIGAGAVVVKDVTDSGVYVGNPSHPINRGSRGD